MPLSSWLDDHIFYASFEETDATTLTSFQILERHEEERIQREATRRAGYQANERMKKNFQDLSSKNPEKRDRNLAERARYQFEVCNSPKVTIEFCSFVQADSDDENMENEIDDNIDQLSAITGRLNMLARATGEEVDHQNKALQRVSEKVSLLELQTFVSHCLHHSY